MLIPRPVNRGGSWFDPARSARSAFRVNTNPTMGYRSHGMRFMRRSNSSAFSAAGLRTFWVCARSTRGSPSAKWTPSGFASRTSACAPYGDNHDDQT